MHARSRTIAGGSALALGIVAIIAAAAPASAADLTCGSVIVTSTSLTHDLVCDGTTDGLVIGANGITLDLKGFTISGPGAYATLKAGVRSAQHTGVTITNGTVTGFQAAVVLDESTTNVISKVTATGNDQGINLSGGGGHIVTKNSISGSGRDAIRVGLSAGNVISQNTASGNYYGIFVADGSSNNRVERNTVTGTVAPGLATFSNTSATTFSQNTVTGGGDDGLQVASNTSGTIVSQNTFAFNVGDGIDAAGATTLAKNTAVYNGQLGIRAVAPVIDGGGNKAAFNGDPAQCVGVVCSAP
jgi:parallel beta-helix repeat protein